MSTTVARQLSAALSQGQKAALVRLLNDEDPAIYQVVRDRILSCGVDSTEWLRPHTLSSDPVLRRRAQEIVHRLARGEADDRFLTFCLKEGNDLDLEQGAWLLSRTQYPDINLEAYSALFDSYAGELRERIDPRSEASQTLATLNEYLFEVLRFKANEQEVQDPENCYLNRVVDRRTGKPISLCLVYISLARRLRLPVTGISLPSHFICRFQSSWEEYYIDVFNRGKLWTKADCIQYLLYQNHTARADYLAPVSSRRVLMQVCAELHQVYRRLKMPEEALRVQRYLIALAK